MTVLLLCHGGSRRARRWCKRYQRWFNAQGTDIVALYTSGESDTDNRQLQQHIAVVDEVVVLAGDGTLHWLVNNLAEADRKRLAIAVIPVGTGNDFARDLEITNKRWRMQAQAKLEQRAVTLGQCGEHYFINAASSGLTADLVMRQSTLSKALLGRLSYLLGVLGWWLRYDYSVNKDSDEKREPVLKSYLVGRYLGGGIALAPQAKRSAVALTVVTINAGSRWQLLMVLWRVLRRQHIVKRHPLVTVESVSTARLQQNLMEMDGEYYKLAATPVEQRQVTVHPNFLTLLIPKN